MLAALLLLVLSPVRLGAWAGCEDDQMLPPVPPQLMNRVPV